MRKFQIPNQPETGSSPGLWRSEKVRIVLMAVALLIVGGAFLVLLAVMAAPSFSGQMACVAASVVGYQLRALQAFFGPSN